MQSISRLKHKDEEATDFFGIIVGVWRNYACQIIDSSAVILVELSNNSVYMKKSRTEKYLFPSLFVYVLVYFFKKYL